MEAYFDNSATTRCFEEVKDIVVKTMMEDFGNPSAMHQKRCRRRKGMSKNLPELWHRY